MSQLFLTNVNMNGNQIENAVIQNLAAAPGSPKAGQVYYDTAKNQFGYYNGTAWVYTAAPPDITVKADKVSGAVNGNFAGLDASGNLKDSGSKAADFLLAGGTATKATQLATPRALSITGGATAAGVNFDGSGPVALNVTALDATKLNGTIPIASMPPAALERLVIVADDTARLALTTASAQVGDTVKVTSTGKMYYVKDDTKLSSEDGYEPYTAGSASAVPWSGVTGKPTTVSGYGITDAYTKTEIDNKVTGVAKKYTVDNPALSPTGGVATWTVTHNLNTRAVVISLSQAASPFQEVLVEVAKPTVNTITISIVASASIAAGTYTVTVIG